MSSDAGKDTAAKQTRKRRREPTVKIEEKKKTGPKGKGGEGPPGWVWPLFVHDEKDRLVRCSPPSSAGGTGKKGEYVTCLICHQKVSFNKYSWATPRQHMRKHNIDSPSDLETVLQLAKQVLEGRAGLRGGKASQGWRLEGATSNAEDYRLPGWRGLPSARKRDNGIQPGAKGCELVDCDGLPPLCHCRHACISSHATCVGPASPRIWAERV